MKNRKPPPMSKELLLRLSGNPKYGIDSDAFKEFQRTGGAERVIPLVLDNYLEMDEYKTVLCVAEGQSRTGDPRFNPPEEEENKDLKLMWIALHWLTQRGAKFKHLWFLDDQFADLKVEDGFTGTDVSFRVFEQPKWSWIDVARSYVRRHRIKIGSELEDIWEEMYQEEMFSGIDEEAVH